jgi:hypothetical protein
MVNGKYVNVWCNGVLDKSDEDLENGEIVYGTQPTCESLKKDGYIATENGKCFGKYYDTSKYHIECEGNLAPERIIILNGAEYSNIMHAGPKNETEAEKIFNKMQSVSKSQKAQYFKK